MPKRRKRNAPAPGQPASGQGPAKIPPPLAGLKHVYREWQQEQQALHARRPEVEATAGDAWRPSSGAGRTPPPTGTGAATGVSSADQALFRRMVGRVTPLEHTGRITPRNQRPRPVPLQRWADDDAVLRESLSDDYGAEWLLETDESLSFRRAGLGADVVRKLRRGHWTVTAQVDLHGLRVDEAREVVADFLRDCVKQERRCVRIIHGKGLGSVNRTPVLKEKVRRWLTQKDEVLAFVEARPIDGGEGVVLALLKRA